VFAVVEMMLGIAAGPQVSGVPSVQVGFICSSSGDDTASGLSGRKRLTKCIEYVPTSPYEVVTVVGAIAAASDAFTENPPVLFSVTSAQPKSGTITTRGEMSCSFVKRKPVGRKPASVVHVELQPSPLVVLPSSQVSAGVAPASR